MTRTLNITLTCDPERLVFDSNGDLADAQYGAFITALGRQLFYAMRYAPDHDTLNVQMSVLVGSDMTDTEVGMYLQVPSSERGFMCAAVSRRDGTEYTYHS